MVCIKEERSMINNIIKFKSLVFFCSVLWLVFVVSPVFSQESLTSVIIDDGNDNDNKKNDDLVKSGDLNNKSQIIDTLDKKVSDVLDKSDDNDKKQKNNDLGKVSGIEDVLLQQKPITSVMFSDVDEKNIDRAVRAYKNKEKFVVNQDSDSKKAKDKSGKKKDPIENETSFLHLSSIIYFASDAWSLWVDSVKISSDSNKVGSDLYVKFISSEKVTIVWTMSISKWKILSGKVSESDAPKINKNDQVEVEFTLKQNQTYMLTTNKVIEGKMNVEGDKSKDKKIDAVPPA